MQSLRLVRTIPLAIACFLTLTSHARAENAASSPISAEGRDFFENRIRPILTEHCLECHSSELDESEGNLQLDSRDGWLHGGDNGPAVAVGRPEDSLLVEAILYENVDLQMPPDGKLSQADIASVVKWVEMGAPDPRRGEVGKAHATAIDVEQRLTDHWAWQAIQSGQPPVVNNAHWPNKPLDRYILARLETAGLSPAPPAYRATLLRRVSFDLIGLPPTPDELAAFVADDSDMAYARVVDRLLDSPHFGEHWGQHWLDLVRYAETRGHEQDFAIPEAYRFRDYVVLALNENVPYDQFLVEHLAGDLLEPARLHPENRTNQSIQGTGFWHLHEQTHSPVDIQGDEADRMHNQIDVFSRTFLGLSVGCARCHDHKFDPISMRDYYALYGYLQSSSYRVTDVSDPIKQRELFDALLGLNRQSAPQLLRSFLAMRTEQLEHFPTTLLAAAELLAAGTSLDAVVEQPPGDKKKEPPPAKPAATVTDLAAKRGIAADALWRLAKHLKKIGADNNLRDPLYVFARAATSNTAPDTTGISQIQVDVKHGLAEFERQHAERKANQKVIKSVKDGERNYRTEQRPWSTADIVEDFAFVGDQPNRWITDGYRFGNGPCERGSIFLSDDAAQPIKWLLDTPAAQAISNRLPGFIRTQTFEVVGDRLWYRYRGNAEVFLAVDSHRVVAGPLHGVVKQKLRGDETQWRWASHHVRDYLGHRVHVEFVPDGDFAIDQIVFAADQPPTYQPTAAAVVNMVTKTEQLTDLHSLAERTAAALVQAINTPRPDIPTVNWLLQHDELLPAGDATAKEFAQVVSQYARAREGIEDRLPTPVRALALLDGDSENEPLHIRGNHRSRSPELVPRQNLAALRRDRGENQRQRPVESAGSGRLHLARALVRRDNPLVARVFINRVWHHLFGRGIVETVDDFGVMGTPPTHPALLDHLATQFVDNGWSVKDAIRNIVLSSTYQMSSYPTPEATAVDPANKLFHRMPIRRLPAESIRDHILAVSGRLDRRMYGKSTMVHITPYMRGNRSPGGSGPLDGDGRRSIYTEVRRNHLSAFLTAFDKPAPFMAIGRRNVSNAPAQSLILLNDPFVHQQASIWAQRLMGMDTSDEARIEQAYLLAFSRRPSNDEQRAAAEFVSSQQQAYAAETEDSTKRAWTDLCHTLFNVKEFVHIN